MADIVISGNTSGAVTLRAPDVSGTTLLTLPTTSGTIVTTTEATSLTTSGNLTFTGTGNRITGDFSNGTAANRVMIQTSTVNGGTFVSAIPNGSGTSTAFVVENSSTPLNNSFGGVQIIGTVDFVSGARGSGTQLPMTFQVNTAERMRIDTSGNVGIGTSSPNLSSSSTALTVNTGTAANFAAIELASGGTLNFYINANNSASYIDSRGTRPMVFYTNSTERMRIDSSGNVGIGTSSPASSLEIARGSGVAAGLSLRGNANAAAAEVFVGQGGGSQGFLYNRANEGLYFGTNNTERMRITSGGDLRLGTTAGIWADERASIQAGSTGGYALTLSTETAGGYSPLLLRNNDGNSTKNQIFFAHSNSIVGSVTTTASATQYNTSSDYRLKENVAPMTDALAKLAQLKPVTYKWKVDGSAGEGFIAHELAEVVPQCVTGEKDAVDKDGNPVYQGVDTSFLVATLTAAIQEQQVMIEELKQEVAAQAAEIAALKGVN